VSEQVLWAPWRMSYVAGPKPASGCIFCDLPTHGDARENLVLRADPDAVVMLNRYPYNNGHLMVAPREHVADPLGLPVEAHRALMDRLRDAIDVVRRAFSPDGMNVGANLGRIAGAGVAEHLHWHVVPRWSGDTNFMPVIAETRVMPQHLLASYDALKPYFA